MTATQKKFLSILLLATGAVLLIAGLFGILSPRTVRAVLDNKKPEVITDQPLHAIHEMEPFDPASIPFLAEGGPQPNITAPENFYDFGSIGSTEVVQHDFLISNEGDAPLTISRAYTTCGCTTADISATVIPPGKAVRVTLIFDAGYHKEAAGTTVRRGLIIENNDPNNYQFEIWTQASVRTGP